MDPRYARTPMGQAEIQSRALGLSRSVRNLLLVINPSQTGAEWLGQVRGVTPDDLARLLAEGLIAPVAGAASGPATASTGATATAATAAAARPAAAAAPVSPPPPLPGDAGIAPRAATPPLPAAVPGPGRATPPADELARALDALLRCIADARYGSLYDVLTGQAKARLGLLKGYKLVLEVEKADGVTGLRLLASQVATDWSRSHGLEALHDLHRAIAAREASTPPPAG